MKKIYLVFNTIIICFLLASFSMKQPPGFPDTVCIYENSDYYIIKISTNLKDIENYYIDTIWFGAGGRWVFPDINAFGLNDNLYEEKGKLCFNINKNDILKSNIGDFDNEIIINENLIYTATFTLGHNLKGELEDYWRNGN